MLPSPFRRPAICTERSNEASWETPRIVPGFALQEGWLASC